jgi:hypothetical protein
MKLYDAAIEAYKRPLCQRFWANFHFPNWPESRGVDFQGGCLFTTIGLIAGLYTPNELYYSGGYERLVLGACKRKWPFLKDRIALPSLLGRTPDAPATLPLYTVILTLFDWSGSVHPYRELVKDTMQDSTLLQRTELILSLILEHEEEYHAVDNEANELCNQLSEVREEVLV